ncbi:hypothetical protein M011DRAFT_32663 [Sporormia fimetaria CBS 119925]|uniref:Uncharacterized protein n=1 Tax=Sporormia fimetaria CBS 119925 TaxID=1340428 RepID=A0A6A6VD88_9PLEO|nr:hypothetical protein M011DRAFT_32663 [Sporormia fimetaria CBS 119925]
MGNARATPGTPSIMYGDRLCHGGFLMISKMVCVAVNYPSARAWFPVGNVASAYPRRPRFRTIGACSWLLEARSFSDALGTIRPPLTSAAPDVKKIPRLIERVVRMMLLCVFRNHFALTPRSRQRPWSLALLHRGAESCGGEERSESESDEELGRRTCWLLCRLPKWDNPPMCDWRRAGSSPLPSSATDLLSTCSGPRTQSGTQNGRSCQNCALSSSGVRWSSQSLD